MGKSENRGAEELQDYTLLSLYDSLIERVPYQVAPLFQLIFMCGAVIVILCFVLYFLIFFYFCFFLLMLICSLLTTPVEKRKKRKRSLFLEHTPKHSSKNKNISSVFILFTFMQI